MPVDNNLHKAAHKGDFELVRKCIEGSPEDDIDPIDVNGPGAADRRALHRSAGAGFLDITAYLLDKGATLDAADKSGRTALHWAAISGHTEIVNFLLSKGADILAVTTSNMNALQLACEGGRIDTVRALMSFVSGDDDKKTKMSLAKNDEGKTAWDIAVGAKAAELCKTLKECGDVNGQSASCVIS